MPHIALLGDSILDNRAYAAGAPGVVEHLRDLLPAGWNATLLAIDGSVIDDLSRQLERVPPAATHLVVSIGGNDVLGNVDLLDTRVRSTAEALDLFSGRLARFETGYRRAIDRALALGKPTTLCTIYNGNFEADEAVRTKVALTVFNDVILRTVFERGLNAIELRLVCTDPADYANEIEPSGSGGRKIAEAIAQSCGAREPQAPAKVYSVATPRPAD